MIWCALHFVNDVYRLMMPFHESTHDVCIHDHRQAATFRWQRHWGLFRVGVKATSDGSRTAITYDWEVSVFKFSTKCERNFDLIFRVFFRRIRMYVECILIFMDTLSFPFLPHPPTHPPASRVSFVRSGWTVCGSCTWFRLIFCERIPVASPRVTQWQGLSCGWCHTFLPHPQNSDIFESQR